MTTLAALEKERLAAAGKSSSKRPASRTIRLEPDAFSDTWELRPATAIVCGIRVPSEQDVQLARSQAAKHAVELHEASEPERIDAFNDALCQSLICRALCDPNDVTQVHPMFELPDEIVPVALKSKTITFIFDAVERLQVEQSPLYEEATAEEIGDVVASLHAGALDRLPATYARRCRRFLRFILDDLKALET